MATTVVSKTRLGMIGMAVILAAALLGAGVLRPARRDGQVTASLPVARARSAGEVPEARNAETGGFPRHAMVSAMTGVPFFERAVEAQPGVDAPAPPAVPDGTGGVSGRMFLDEGVPAEQLLLVIDRLEWPGSAARKRPVWTLRELLGPDGRFVLRGLPPGAATISIGLHPDAAPLVVVDPVAIQAGQVNEDPRLDPIDLRGRVRPLTVTVAAGQDRSVAGVRVKALARDGKTVVRESETDAEGRILVLLGSEPLSLSAWHPEHGVVRVEAVEQDVLMRLPPRLDLGLSIAASALPQGPPYVWMKLERVDPDGADPGLLRPGDWPDFAYEAIDVNGFGRLTIHSPGHYRVSLHLEPIRDKLA